MNKKIIVIKSLNGGGAERILLNFAKKFHATHGEEKLKLVCLLKEGELLNQVLPSNIEFVYEPKSKIDKYLCLLKLFLFRKKIAQKYCSSEEPYSLISFLEGWSDMIIHSTKVNQHCKKISWLHCGFGLFKKYNPVRILFLKYATKSSVINCVSDYVKHSIPDIKNTKTVYNFIDTEFIKSKASEELNSPLFDKNKKHIVAIGRLVYQKNFEFLLSSLSIALKKDNNIHLHLIGDGELRKDLEKQAISLNIQENVTFVGFTDNPYSYIKQADLVCMTSHFEGLPTVVIESAVLNKPVITTQCGAKELLSIFNYQEEIPFDCEVYASAIINNLNNGECSIDEKLFEEKFSFENFIRNM